MGGLKDLQRVWNHLGRQDPLWAILSDPAKRGNRWQVDEFFETGRREIAALMNFVDALPVLRRRGAALDFGCGAGRLSQALAEHYKDVCGVDIAPSMIALAERHNRHPETCRYVVNDSPDLGLFEDDSFDLVYSNITLQHMEPRFSKRYIAEFVRIVAPGGVVIFQLPSRKKARAENPGAATRFRRTLATAAPRPLVGLYRSLRTRVRLLADRGHFDSYEVPRAEVEQVLAASGARVLDIVPDHSGGPEVEGFRYCVTKA